MTKIREAASNALHKVITIQELIGQVKAVCNTVSNMRGWYGKSVYEAAEPLLVELYKLESAAWQSFLAMAVMLPNDKIQELRGLVHDQFFADAEDQLKRSVAHYLSKYYDSPARWLVSDEDELRQELEESING